MKISASLTQSLVDYLGGGNAETTDLDSSVSVLPSGTYSKLAAAQYIRNNDKDNDGKLTQDEVSISAEAYARLDADANGAVSQDELASSLEDSNDTLFQYYKNGGAKSSKDLTGELLASSNAGATGSYSSLGASRFLSAKDKDGNGVLSASEAGLTASVFQKVDADESGTLTKTELKTALAEKNALYTKYYKNGGTQSLAELTSTILGTI